MAYGNITITYERRPCYVKMANGDKKKAMFHRWIDNAYTIDAVLKYQTAGQFWQVRGLVEYEDGSVHLVGCKEIQFADGGDFEETIFFDEKQGG